MNFKTTNLNGVYLIDQKRASDTRGSFIKYFENNKFVEAGLECDFAESFYSISQKNVIRGMHFQIPPYDHHKLVVCLTGKFLDVLIDLRFGENYGKIESFELSANGGQSLFIPKGIAHGFLSLEDNSMMLYQVTTEHSALHDKGINPLTIGFNWGVKNPIMSERDLSHPSLEEYTSKLGL